MTRFSPDPAEISLDRFRVLITSKQLSPGRKILLEDISARFGALTANGFNDLQQLIHGLKTRSGMAAMEKKTGVPFPYLKVLAREARSYLPRAYPLSELPGIPFEYTESLRAAGMLSTRDFFSATDGAGSQEALSRKTGIPLIRIGEIRCLCDLTRITGVGPLYARICYLSGVRSLRDYAASKPEELRKKHTEAIRTARMKVNLPSLEDIRFCRTYADFIMNTTGT